MIEQLCGNHVEYQEILDWINDHINIKPSIISCNDLLFVSGNYGIGKTYSINKICEHLNLDTIRLTINTCISSTELLDNITKITSSSLLKILKNENRPKIILIDEFEAMLAFDRTISTTLFNILSQGKLKQVPIICIISPDNLKKLGAIKKKCKIIELNHPSDDDMISVLQREYDIQTSKLKKIVLDCKNNLSQCIFKIQDKNQIYYDNVDEIMNINSLYSQDYNIIHIIRIVTNDPWLIPLRFHENLITELGKRYTMINKRNMYYNFFITNMVFFDTFMCANLTDLACSFFSTIVYPLSRMPLKKNSKSDISKFTKLLSYTSLQTKYNKKSYSSYFPLYQISNYHVNMGRNYIFFN